MMQPDIGQTLLIFLSWVTLVFISGISLMYFLAFFSISLYLYLYGFFIPKFDYIRNRIFLF